MSRVRPMAICWCVVAPIIYLIDLLLPRLLDPVTRSGRPFGDDFINYWSAAWLAWHGRASEIYDWNAFHQFETGVAGAPIDFYHYSYPPVMLILTAPLAAIPYVPGLFVWLLSGWGAFYAALRAASPNGLWLALATPAVFINAVGGQNGTWTAALLGGGLSILDRRPLVAGALFGLLIYKPQIGILVPVALIAGGYWRTIAAAFTTAVVLIGASVLLFGVRLWSQYGANASVLRQLILEDGTGVWHRMMSVFVAARRLGADVIAAYAVQGAVALLVAAIVVWLWRQHARGVPIRNAVLVLGTCLSTPYLQDYDLVVGAFVAAWVVQGFGERSRTGLIVAGAVLVLPLLGARLAASTGLAFGPLVLAPAFAVVVWQAVRMIAPPAQPRLLLASPQMSKNTVSLSPWRTMSNV